MTSLRATRKTQRGKVKLRWGGVKLVGEDSEEATFGQRLDRVSECTALPRP